MIYETFIFRPNDKKKRDDLMYTAYILLPAVVIFVFYLIGIPGIGALTGIAISYKLIKMKMEDDKKMGIRRLGHLIDKLVISENNISFGNQEVLVSELRNVLIYAHDYVGKSVSIFGTSLGINNSIEFEYKGTKYDFQFLIKSHEEMKAVYNMALIIEKKTLVYDSSRR